MLGAWRLDCKELWRAWRAGRISTSFLKKITQTEPAQRHESLSDAAALPEKKPAMHRRILADSGLQADEALTPQSVPPPVLFLAVRQTELFEVVPGSRAAGRVSRKRFFCSGGPYLLDDRRVFSAIAPCVALPPASVQSDAGNNPRRPAAMAARFDVDLEDPLQALHPGHCHMSRGGRAVCFLARAPAALARYHLRAAVRCKDAVTAHEVHVRFWYQCRQPCDEIQRLGPSTWAAPYFNRLSIGCRWMGSGPR